MRTVVTGRNLDIPDADREYVVRKMGRLERLLDDRTDASVELSRAAHRAQDETAIVEVTLLMDGRPLRAVARAASHRAATDQVVDRLERQVVDHKERRSKPVERRSAADVGAPATSSVAPDSAPPTIVKVKRFAIEPMFEEDAVTRMEELGHDFFVFVNAESERTAVLYRRRDGDYGLIEPTVGERYSSGLSGDGGPAGTTSAAGSAGQSASGRRR
ncbi:MAG: ribosome-associated translation inhibitor RaiA [Candidatus Limnocylindrales bacterium]